MSLTSNHTPDILAALRRTPECSGPLLISPQRFWRPCGRPQSALAHFLSRPRDSGGLTADPRVLWPISDHILETLAALLRTPECSGPLLITPQRLWRPYCGPQRALAYFHRNGRKPTKRSRRSLHKASQIFDRRIRYPQRMFQVTGSSSNYHTYLTNI